MELRRGIEAEAGPVYWMADRIANPNARGPTFPDEWLKIPEIPMIGFYGTFSVKRVWNYEDLAPDYARSPGAHLCAPGGARLARMTGAVKRWEASSSCLAR